jgi:hypothetical protein
MIPAVSLAALLAGPPALAQDMAEAPRTVWSLSATTAHQLGADLDSGGEVGLSRAWLNASATRRLDARYEAGVNLSYQFDDWSFDDPAAFGNRAPWGDIHRAGLGLRLSYAGENGWRYNFSPSVQWAGESGADTGDGFVYGAMAFATKAFSPRLTLGMGLAVFQDIEETRFFPFLAVNWNITDRLKLANPFPAGPAGPGGLELSYALDNGREVGFGAAFRSYRFALDANGPSSGGIGEAESIPVFLRASQKLGKATRLDIYAGAMFNGKLTVELPNGAGEISEKYGTAPFIGITLGTRF